LPHPGNNGKLRYRNKAFVRAIEVRLTVLQAGIVAVAFYGFALPAYAYLDPGTGSMVVSAIVGLVATVGLALKTYWYKLRNFFKHAEGEEPDPEDTESESQ
jgi:hypothetical protein